MRSIRFFLCLESLDVCFLFDPRQAEFLQLFGKLHIQRLELRFQFGFGFLVVGCIKDDRRDLVIDVSECQTLFFLSSFNSLLCRLWRPTETVSRSRSPSWI